jgi:diguanylate cyclase (GGDEF)-like protein/PAS domain S-box-containing protein
VHLGGSALDIWWQWELAPVGRDVGGGEETLARTEELLDARPIREIHAFLSKLHHGDEFSDSVSSIAQALVDILGFTGACVNLADGDDFVAASVAGHEVHQSLLGQRSSADSWHELEVASQSWHGLCLVRDPRGVTEGLSVVPVQRPDELIGAEEHWGALTMLMVMMRSAGGQLIGVITVEGAVGSSLPSRAECALLEIFGSGVGLVLDRQVIHDRLLRERDRLRDSEERFRLAFDGAPIGMCMVRIEPRQVFVVDTNQAFADMFSASEDELRQRPFPTLIHPDDRDTYSDEMRSLFAEGHLTTEKRFLRYDRTSFWGLQHAAMVPDRHGGRGALIQIVDITRTKDAVRTLDHRARHDPLTGLANRTELRNRLDLTVAVAKGSGRPGAVLFIDLDAFKQVNDMYGHPTGDEVLSVIAGRVRKAVRAGDVVGRIGGDEFVVVAHPLPTVDAERMADRIAESLRLPIAIGDVEAYVTASIGVVGVDGLTEGQEVLRRADAAMYRAKLRPSGLAYAVDKA